MQFILELLWDISRNSYLGDPPGDQPMEDRP
jgi:hypothetical protein